MLISVARSVGRGGIGLLLGKVSSGAVVAVGARSGISSATVKGITRVGVLLLLLLLGRLLLLEGGMLRGSMVLTRLVRLGVAILHWM